MRKRAQLYNPLLNNFNKPQRTNRTNHFILKKSPLSHLVKPFQILVFSEPGLNP